MTEYLPPNELTVEQERALYNPEKTPDIIFGLLLLRLNTQRISEILGVSIQTLNYWIANEPKLAEINDRVVMADADVLSALLKSDCGIADEKGFWITTPNIQAIKTWIQYRKMGEKAEDSDQPSGMSDEDRHKLAKDILHEIKGGIPVTIKSRG